MDGGNWPDRSWSRLVGFSSCNTSAQKRTVRPKPWLRWPSALRSQLLRALPPGQPGARRWWTGVFMLSSTSWICCVTLRLVRRLTANCLWRIAMTLVVRRCSGVRASAPVVMQSGVAGFAHVSVGCVSRFFGQDASGLHAFWLSHCGPEVRTPATPQRASPIVAQSHLCHRWAPVQQRPHRRAHRRHLSQLRQLQWQLHSRTNRTKATSEVRMARLLGGSPSGPPQPLGALVLTATATRKAAGPRGPRKELHLWTVSSNGCRRGLRGRGAPSISKPARRDALSLCPA